MLGNEQLHQPQSSTEFLKQIKHGHGQILLRAWRGVRLWGVLVSFFSLKVKFLAC
jgi:hypothetical protein